MPTPRRIWLPTALVLAFAAIAFAERPADLKPGNYTNDFAGVIHPDTEAEINALGKELEDKTGAQIAVVTIKTLEGMDVEGFANELFRQWGVGGKAKDSGVLILLALQERKYRFEVGYGLEPILNDAKVGDFGRGMVAQLRKGDYSGAMSLSAQNVAQVIAADKGVTLTGARVLQPQYVPEEEGFAIPWPFLLFIFFFFILPLFNRKSRRRRGGYYGPWIGGGGFGGGWGGGGGGFGGGGFGGFGGGSSGGGGASGSW